MFFQRWSGVAFSAWLGRRAGGLVLALVAVLLCGIAGDRAAWANNFTDFTHYLKIVALANCDSRTSYIE
jgi:hypothetical protein